MVKHRVSNADIVPLWLNQSQPQAKAYSQHFDGYLFFSYRTLIACLIHNDEGEPAVILNNTSYTHTTSKHQSHIRYVCNTYSIPVFNYYQPNKTLGLVPESKEESNHSWNYLRLNNLAYLLTMFKIRVEYTIANLPRLYLFHFYLQMIEDYLNREGRKHIKSSFLIGYCSNLNNYISFFNLPFPLLDLHLPPNENVSSSKEELTRSFHSYLQSIHFQSDLPFSNLQSLLIEGSPIFIN